VGILLQRDAEVEVPGPDDLCLVGTVANILRYVTLPDNTHVIVCQGLQRFRDRRVPARVSFSGGARSGASMKPEVTDSQIEAQHDPAPRARARSPAVSAAGLAGAARRREEYRQPAALADLVASVTELKLSDRQRVLETVDLLRNGSMSCSIACSVASRCCGFRASSTSAPRPASTSASANTCCASS
jgi:ATP-dependent Lon protease